MTLPDPRPDPLDGLRPGMRAVVRRRLDDESRGVTDALGDLVAIDASTVSVRTRHGLEIIDRAAVVAAKEVPPAPSRRGAPHLAISMRDLETTMALGWPAPERASLGEWALRAGAGFTGRANSVLPLGSPGVSLSEAVDYCERWYDDRRLRPLFVLFGPAGFSVEDDQLGRELQARSYEPFNSTAVLTASTRTLPSETPDQASRDGGRVRMEPAGSPQWWEAWAATQDGETADLLAPGSVARTIMNGAADQLFASLEADGRTVGVGRVVFAQRWAGVSALHVAPEHRRTGVAAQLLGAVADAARLRGIPSVYVQVLKANSPARGLYDRLGFSIHHEYRYLGR
jgi:GNAT superfamily N-acetyltransferase